MTNPATFSCGVRAALLSDSAGRWCGDAFGVNDDAIDVRKEGLSIEGISFSDELFEDLSVLSENAGHRFEEWVEFAHALNMTNAIYCIEYETDWAKIWS